MHAVEREFFVFEQKSVKSTSLLNTLIITAKQFHEIFFGEREFLVFEQKFREINVFTKFPIHSVEKYTKMLSL